MPYIKDPDFREICVLVEMIGEIAEDNNITRMVDKTNNILEGYKRE